MKTTNRKVALAAIMTFGGLATVSTARGDIMVGDTVDLTFVGTEATRAVSWEFDGATGSSNAGVLLWGGGVRAFCVQLEENIAGGQTVTFDAVAPEALPDQPPLPGPMGAARSLVMQDLFSRWYDDVMGRSGSDLKNHAAAFQMVIWEISHEMSATGDAAGIFSGLDLASGDMLFDPGANSATVYGIANSMLGSLGNGGFSSYSRLVGLTNNTYQDQLVVVPGVGSLAALMGVAAVGRRRRRG